MTDDYLLDTNVLIYALRRNLDVLAWLDKVRPVSFLYISAVSRTEVFAGMHPREEGMTRALLASLITLPVTIPIADRAGRMIYQHARKGFHVSFPDAIIAATTLEHGLTLVTANIKHFSMLGDQAIALDDLLS